MPGAMGATRPATDVCTSQKRPLRCITLFFELRRLLSGRPKTPPFGNPSRSFHREQGLPLFILPFAGSWIMADCVPDGEDYIVECREHGLHCIAREKGHRSRAQKTEDLAAGVCG